MTDLKQCKFGDRLRTANGQMAIYLEHKDNSGWYCAVQSECGTVFFFPYKDNGQQNTAFNEYEKYNIIGKWEE